MNQKYKITRQPTKKELQLTRSEKAELRRLAEAESRPPRDIEIAPSKMSVTRANKIVDVMAKTLMQKLRDMGQLNPKFDTAQTLRDFKAILGEVLSRKVIIVPPRSSGRKRKKAEHGV